MAEMYLPRVISAWGCGYVSSMKSKDLIRVRRMAETGLARRIREDAGVSLAELALDVGVHKTNVHRWETGSRRPRGEPAIRYLRVLEELARR